MTDRDLTAALPAGFHRVLDRAAASLDALEPACDGLLAELSAEDLRRADERGFFRPEEETRLLDWWARFLTVRDGLWGVIEDVSAPIRGDLTRIRSTDEWRLFALGYVAACRIVGLDRALVEDIATSSVVQRKLNEGDPARRLPRKQFTAIWASLTEPVQALYMDRAMRLALERRDRLVELRECSRIGSFMARLDELEEPLDRSRRRYVKSLAAYGEHALRRRGASSRQQALLAALEWGGRLVAEVQDRWREKRVTPAIRRRIAELLEPGDVLVTRHERAMSNLFLPGYWPHAALYVGTEEDRERLGIEIDEARRERWSGDCCVLEALKDGVRFRPLSETLQVDAVAVLRPELGESDLRLALGRVVVHEGKPYNFDFDFFRGDRLVCTEVIYRAYDGLGDLRFELVERAGRPTLSAEDLLDHALDSGGLRPMALFGTPQAATRLVTGPKVAALLARSYRA